MIFAMQIRAPENVALPTSTTTATRKCYPSTASVAKQKLAQARISGDKIGKRQTKMPAFIAAGIIYKK
jgi:hypothetical protein